MPEDLPNSPETPAAEAAAQEDAVTAEFISGLEEPSTSANGHGAEVEPPFADNPEVVVGAAFIGGFLFGRLVKRLGS